MFCAVTTNEIKNNSLLLCLLSFYLYISTHFLRYIEALMGMRRDDTFHPLIISTIESWEGINDLILIGPILKLGFPGFLGASSSVGGCALTAFSNLVLCYSSAPLYEGQSLQNALYQIPMSHLYFLLAFTHLIHFITANLHSHILCVGPHVKHAIWFLQFLPTWLHWLQLEHNSKIP